MSVFLGLLMQNTEFNFRDYSIEDLLPHSGPMVLINEIIDFSEEHLIAEILIEENCKYYDASLSGVPAWVGVEYMSQAIAALAGVHAKRQNRPIKLGFLLGTRKYLILEKVMKRNHIYEIKVSQLYKDDSGLASFDCRIFDKGRADFLLAEPLECVKSKLNVFETNDLQDIVES